MAEPKSEFLNDLEGGTASFTDEEFARLERYIERSGRAAASATVAPIEGVPSRPISMGMSMPSTIPELRGQTKLVLLLKRFRTWACLKRCDSALDSEIAVNASETTTC